MYRSMYSAVIPTLSGFWNHSWLRSRFAVRRSSSPVIRATPLDPSAPPGAPPPPPPPPHSTHRLVRSFANPLVEPVRCPVCERTSAPGDGQAARPAIVPWGGRARSAGGAGLRGRDDAGGGGQCRERREPLVVGPVVGDQ